MYLTVHSHWSIWGGIAFTADTASSVVRVHVRRGSRRRGAARYRVVWWFLTPLLTMLT